MSSSQRIEVALSDGPTPPIHARCTGSIAPPEKRPYDVGVNGSTLLRPGGCRLARNPP